MDLLAFERGHVARVPARGQAGHGVLAQRPLAQHVAYWHEDYGNLKSAECLNMSPADGRWLFSFTDPPVPKEWGAVGANFGQSTIIMINGF